MVNSSSRHTILVFTGHCFVSMFLFSLRPQRRLHRAVRRTLRVVPDGGHPGGDLVHRHNIHRLLFCLYEYKMFQKNYL